MPTNPSCAAIPHNPFIRCLPKQGFSKNLALDSQLTNGNTAAAVARTATVAFSSSIATANVGLNNCGFNWISRAKHDAWFRRDTVESDRSATNGFYNYTGSSSVVMRIVYSLLSLCFTQFLSHVGFVTCAAIETHSNTARREKEKEALYFRPDIFGSSNMLSHAPAAAATKVFADNSSRSTMSEWASVFVRSTLIVPRSSQLPCRTDFQWEEQPTCRRLQFAPHNKFAVGIEPSFGDKIYAVSLFIARMESFLLSANQ